MNLHNTNADIAFTVMSPRLASVPISVAGTLTMEVTSMLGLEFHQLVATAFLSLHHPMATLLLILLSV